MYIEPLVRSHHLEELVAGLLAVARVEEVLERHRSLEGVDDVQLLALGATERGWSSNYNIINQLIIEYGFNLLLGEVIALLKPADDYTCMNY